MCFLVVENTRDLAGAAGAALQKLFNGVELGPLLVSIDTEGRNLFEENKGVFNERKEKAIEEICKHVSFIK